MDASWKQTVASWQMGPLKDSNGGELLPLWVFCNKRDELCVTTDCWLVANVLCLYLVAQSCPTLCDPMDCRPQMPSIHGDSPGKNTGVSWHTLLLGILTIQGLNPDLPHCRQILSLPFEPPEKPQNTGVGSLFLLQGIFLTQKSNQGLLHCRWVLYQLTYQGSPNGKWVTIKAETEEAGFEIKDKEIWPSRNGHKV